MAKKNTSVPTTAQNIDGKVTMIGKQNVLDAESLTLVIFGIYLNNTIFHSQNPDLFLRL